FTLKKTFAAHADPINIVSLSDDSAVLLTGADDGYLMIWNMQSGEKIQEIPCFFHGAISAISWLGEALSFVFVSSDGVLHLYRRPDLSSMFEVSSLTIAHDDTVQDIKFDRNHRRVASVGGGSAQVWTLNSSGE
ncbi:WD40 repeat-like protein, partial [Laetiporus sulphureus 93-53]